MRRIASLAIAAGFLVPLLASAPASAQATRTWVSGVGDDVNPCSRTAPCKTFAGAISKTATAGEINCLDPGGFGTITITKSMTLNCHEVLGSILASGVPGVTINSTAVGSNVILRGLQINGVQGGTAVAGTIGVRIIAAARVSIEDTVITQFAQQGIADQRTAGNTSLNVRNSILSFNLAAGASLAATGVSFTVLDNVSSINNLNGVSAGTTNNVVIKRSVLASNSGDGASMGAGGQIQIDDCVISNNGNGVNSSGTIKVSNSDFMANTQAFSGTGLFTFQNNRVTGTLGVTPTPASQQ
jgi:Right handed beta helix region